MLIKAGLLRDPILYLSRAIIDRKNDYYRLPRAVTAEGAWIEWTLYMLDVVRESAASTTRKIGSIRGCQEKIAERARAATPGGRDAQFLAVLFEQPYCRINTVADRCGVSRQTASSWLHALVGAGLLSDVKVGREVLFVNHDLLDVLTRPESTTPTASIAPRWVASSDRQVAPFTTIGEHRSATYTVGWGRRATASAGAAGDAGGRRSAAQDFP